MSKIILTADADLVDKEAREWLDQLNTRIDSINNRTKKHTIEIKELRKRIKDMEKKDGLWRKIC